MSIAILKEASGFIMHIDATTKTQNQALPGLELNEGDQLQITARAKCLIEYNTGKTYSFFGKTIDYVVSKEDAGDAEVIKDFKEEKEEIVLASGVVKEDIEIRMDTLVEDNKDKDEYFEAAKERISKENDRFIPIPKVIGAKDGLNDGSFEIYPNDSETDVGDSLFIEYEDQEGNSKSVIYTKVSENLWERQAFPRVACFPNRSDQGAIMIKPGEIGHNTKVSCSIVKADGSAGEVATARVFNKDFEESAQNNSEENELKDENNVEQDSYPSEEQDDEVSNQEEDDRAEYEEDNTADEDTTTEVETHDIEREEIRYKEPKAVKQDSDYQLELEDEEDNIGDKYTIIYLLNDTEEMAQYKKNQRGYWQLEPEYEDGPFTDSKEVKSTITWYNEDLNIKDVVYEPYREHIISIDPIGDDGDIDYKELDSDGYLFTGTFFKNMKLIGHIEGKVFVGDKAIPLRFFKKDDKFFGFDAKIAKEYLLDNDLFKVEITFNRDEGDLDITSYEESEGYFLINTEDDDSGNKVDQKEESQSKEQDDNKEETKEESKEDEKQIKEVDESEFAELEPITINRAIALEGAPSNGFLFLFVDVEGPLPRAYEIENNTIRLGDDDIGNVSDGVANFIVKDLLIPSNTKINIKSKFYKL